MKDLAQLVSVSRLDHDMHMVRHHTPSIQIVSGAFEMHQRIRNKIGKAMIPKGTASIPPVEPEVEAFAELSRQFRAFDDAWFTAG